MEKRNKHFREIRLSLKISQSRMAETLDLSLSTVQRIEQGSQEVSDLTSELLVKRLNVRMDYLNTGKGDMWNDGIMPEISLIDKPSENPYKDALVKQLKEDADKWKEQHDKLWKRLEFFMDKFELGKLSAFDHTGSMYIERSEAAAA